MNELATIGYGHWLMTRHSGARRPCDLYLLLGRWPVLIGRLAGTLLFDLPFFVPLLF